MKLIKINTNNEGLEDAQRAVGDMLHYTTTRWRPAMIKQKYEHPNKTIYSTPVQ